MINMIDLRHDSYGVSVERTTTGVTGVKITFDNSTMDTVLFIGAEGAKDIADGLLDVAGEKTPSEWEDEVYKLQEEINSLQEKIEEYEERMEYMRNKDRYVPF